ncbi:AI-2E family transporter [Pseudohalioglobus lutimaris]|uniref:AI-2E family transporter n=1 Tax=Pseudohalioglobus lutimaris TaxID=1737061 RepID=A0A2N5X8A1_9GAMM|nr:AI-2E family transporter [Pseudohalioglobus lutimaris]PLW70723.1 AI-2E family transporter [Pseudohalioglobus lutimaris]
MSDNVEVAAAHPVRDALLTLASLVVVLAGARFAANLLVPFLLAMFIAIILSSPIGMLRSKGLPEWLSIAVVCSLALGVLALVFMLLGASINGFVGALPGYQAQLGALLDGWVQWLIEHGVEVGREDVSSAFDPAAAVGYLGTFLSGLGDTLSHLFLIMFAVFFILGDASGLKRKMAVGLPDASSQYLTGLRELVESMNNYVTTKTLISLLTGLLVTVGMWLMDVQFALLWGFLAFLLNFVPNIGSIIAAVPPVLLSLLEADLLLTGMIIALYLSVNTLIGNVVEPKVMGKRMGLSTSAVFLSLLFWGWMFGPVGMLLSVPLTMVIRFIALSQPGSAWFAVLISAAPEEPLSNDE